MDKYTNNLKDQEGDDMSSRDKMVKMLTVSLAVVLVALIGITYYFLSRYEKKPAMVSDTNMAPGNQNQAAAGGQKAPAKAAPQVTVAKWEAQVTPPAAPASMNVYKMKQNFSMAEIQAIATKLSATGGMQEAENSVVAYSNTGDSVMMMDKTSGSYAYRSKTGVALPTGASQNESVYALLTNLGMYDSTIKVTSSYMKKSAPGIKFVELHRSWSEVKMPILSSVGLINIPETSKISQLALGKAGVDAPADADIIGTSDGSNGLARPNDFNTITVGISETDNKVHSITSNARILTAESMTVSAIAQADVLAALQANKQSMIFTSPSGDGAADFSKVYPGNQVMSDMATITDIGLAYIENAPTVAQTQLEPQYVVRGFMQSANGYRLNFVATVPASKQPQAWFKIPNIKLPSLGSLMGIVGVVNAQVDNPGVDDPGQKQGTLTFPTEAPASVDQPVASSCHPAEGDMADGSVHEFGTMRVGFGPRDAGDKWEWYYLNRTGKTQEQILADIQVLLQSIHDTIPDTSATEGREKMEKLIKDILATPDCPVRFTGSSPTVFAYGAEGSKMNISVDHNLTYTEPAAHANAWNVTVGNKGLNVDGNARDYVYYEYEKVDFARPSQGWVVSRSQVASLAKEIAGKMEMNAVEAVRLNFELNHALADVKSNNVFIGMIGQAEVDAKLPMNVSPMPEAVARYHFYVGAAHGSVQAPTLFPVDRATTMVLELGAAGYNN